MNENLSLDDEADFIWLWGYEFFLETTKGNFIWSDPEYPGGNNTIRFYDGSCKQYCDSLGLQFGREKGRYIIRDYCGSEVKFL